MKRSHATYLPQIDAALAAGEEVAYAMREFMTTAQHELDRANKQQRNAAAIEAWRAGRNALVPRGTSAMLRVRGPLVETSWGASFPVEHAVRAWPLLKAFHDAGREYKRNGHTIHLGHFAIDHVSADGTVTAGCHVVLWSEVERVACALGLLEASIISDREG